MASSAFRRFDRFRNWTIIAAFPIFFAAELALALPRYSARYGQDCQLCHFDPNGGGLRSTYASQYLVPAGMAWKAPDLDEIDPQLNDYVLIGIDIRTLLVQAEQGGGVVLNMQSDVHFAIQADQRASAAVTVGQGGAQEAFGLLYVLPANGHVKAGRIVPAYGWRFADHQLYGRRYVLSRTGENDPRAWQSSGVELGAAPGPIRVSASVEGPGKIGDSWTARAIARENFGALQLALGASFLRRELEEGHRRVAGAFGYAAFGALAWLFEWDEPRQVDRHERILTSELVYQLSRGWNARLTAGFHDPDRDLQSGARRQWGAGLDLFATPFFGVLVMARYEDVDPGPEVGSDRFEVDLVLHFLY